MNMKLELIPLPVSDVEQSLIFYRDKVGFHLDHDIQPGNGMRIIQFTPPGSACSIAIGIGIGDNSLAGSYKGLHLVVDNIDEARAELITRGIEMSDVQDMGGVKYSYFSDPDENTWALQEISPNAKP